jgi:hypothetical protein
MRSVVALAVVGVCWVLAGCGADLGSCDVVAAEQVVYLNGTPYFEGQALVEQSCAGSQCHAAAATGGSRSGVPHGLNFDVQVLTAESDPSRLGVLREGISRIRDEAADVWKFIDNGEMPPGAVGARLGLPWKRDAAGMVDAALAGVDTAAGRNIVRNWLACGSPLVSATTDSPLAQQAAVFGAVMEGGSGGAVMPTWDSIYTNVLSQCVGCHKPGSEFAALDLSTKEGAYTALIDKAGAASGNCAARKLVIPGNCQDSVLYTKLQPKEAVAMGKVCGGQMPKGGMPIPAAQLQAVCDWINAGALQM